MTRILIQNGRVIDPSQEMDQTIDVLVENGKIAAYSGQADHVDQVIDATGQIVAPGLIDLSAQLGEPGREEDETILTATAAAVAGGFTSILCLPNTEPPIDSQASVEFIHQKAARANNCHVLVAGCVSKDRAGKELAEIGSLVEAGALALTDAPRPIQNSELLRRALEYCLMFDKPILSHTEDWELSHDGVMHEGKISMMLALPGLPTEAEDVMASRDIRLAESTGGRLHLLNISTASSVDQVRRAKARGINITAGIVPINAVLTDECLRTFDSNYKLNPPLRSQEHVDACLAGLADGTIEVICSGHTPRASEKKMLELDLAPFGMVALETTLGLVVTKLIEPGHLDWMSALAKMTIHPARVLGIDRGTLRIGADADIVIIDPHASWTVDPTTFRSKSTNTPLAGWTLRGRAVQTIVAGDPKL